MGYSSLVVNKTIPSSALESQARFEDWSDSYRDTKRAKCSAAFRETYHRHEGLENETFKHVGHTMTELLQVEPVLIQRESYGDDGAHSMIRYEELCRDTAGGRFEVWNGIMDGLGIRPSNLGSKRTTILENSATCFPPGNAC